MSGHRSTPGALADAAMLAARQAALAAPGMAPLVGFAAAIRSAHGPTPDFDPADGGVAARVLLLLETPGPKTGRTGLVSADNPTGTSANLRRFLAAAGIDRRRLVIWNAVPWVIHAGGPNRAPRPAELRLGLAELPGLLPLLPKLRCAVLCGRAASQAEPVLREAGPGLTLIRAPHPSPTYVCTSPDVPRRIIAAFAEAARIVASDAQPGSGSLAGRR